MCTIKRINRLKSLNLSVLSKIENGNPLSFIDKGMVSASGLTYTDLSDRLDKLRSCCSIVELKTGYVDNHDGSYDQTLSVSTANFCKQRTVCPTCADRSQVRRQVRYSDSIKKQADMVVSGERYAYMITYTVVDGEDLSERIDHLRQSKRRFMKMGQRRGLIRSSGESAKIRAALSTVEIKRGHNSGEWHVHSHDLVFSDRPISYQVYHQGRKKELERIYGSKIPVEALKTAAMQTIEISGSIVPVSKISMEWHDATLGDSISIHVAPIRHVPRHASAKKKRILSKLTFAESVLYQAKECLKYPTKPLDHSPADLLELLSSCYNRRLTSSYGDFYGIAGNDYDDDGGIDAVDSDTYCIVWDDSAGSYRDPVPGSYRDLQGSEEESMARRKAGQLLGEYRRMRRSLLDRRDAYGSDLSRILDQAKCTYRRDVAAIYSTARRAGDYRYRSDGDTGVSALLSPAGIYVPDEGCGTYSAYYSLAFTDG